MPESLKGWSSDDVKVSGLANHFACFVKLSVSGLSMSMTVDRLTRSIARVEYSFSDEANTRQRPRLIIGAANDMSPAPAADFRSSRRVILIDIRLHQETTLACFPPAGRPSTNSCCRSFS